MDTLVNSTVITMDADFGKELNKNIQAIIDEVEGRISRTIETSEIYMLNNAPDMELSDDMIELIALVRTIAYYTNGAFDPRLGELMDLWGFYNHDENIERTLPQIDKFSAALRNKSRYDLGAIGKGYALDYVHEYLKGEKIQNALVSFTSSILALGRNRQGNLWQVGIKDPVNTERTAGVIEASDKFISVSAGYERFININGINYAHIIDPATGYPVDNDLLCVVVITDAVTGQNYGALSDALSTALYVMGRQGALDFYMSSDFDFEMILFYKSESDPRGYEILQTNVSFNER
jgi:thiamine biosynthesis lipoprotein